MKQVLAVCGSLAHWKPVESQPYEEALRAVGIEPVLVSPETFAWTAGDIPEAASGLLLMGGSDVNPARYAEARHPETQDPDDPRDELECALIKEALARDQILNVAHGGSLVQHLDSTERHRRRTENRGLPAHRVEIVPGTHLASILEGVLTLDVNSRHHQAIARLGDGLLVSARDPEDGTIEAVEQPDKRFVVGVEWHPENMAPTDPLQARLFQAFAQAL
jgi:putative glutamine amidotransferase